MNQSDPMGTNPVLPLTPKPNRPYRKHLLFIGIALCVALAIALIMQRVWWEVWLLILFIRYPLPILLKHLIGFALRLLVGIVLRVAVKVATVILWIGLIGVILSLCGG